MMRVLYGADTFSRQERLAEIKRGLDSDGMLESNTTVLDGATVTPELLRNQCNTVPFLAARRLVIVEGLAKRTEPRGRARQGEDEETPSDEQTNGDGLPNWRFLREFPAAMPETTELILIDGEVSGRNMLISDLKPVATVEEFRFPGRNELPEWITKRAADKGLRLSPRAAALIAENAGHDLWALNNELEKMAVYAAGAACSDDELLSLLTSSREQSIFALCDQIGEGRRGQALASLRRLLTEGSSPQYILSMISRHFRLLALAREAMDRRLPPGQLMERLETRSQYVVDKAIRQARSYALPLLTRCYKRIVQCDFDTKRGVYSAELSLELLVGDLAGLNSR